MATFVLGFTPASIDMVQTRAAHRLEKIERAHNQVVQQNQKHTDRVNTKVEGQALAAEEYSFFKHTYSRQFGRTQTPLFGMEVSISLLKRKSMLPHNKCYANLLSHKYEGHGSVADGLSR